MQVDATVIWAEIPWSLVFGKGYRNGIVGTWGGFECLAPNISCSVGRGEARGGQ